MGWYADTNAWAAKISKRISKRQRRIAAAVLTLAWGAAIYFRWPVNPMFFIIPAIQLGFSSLYMEDDTPATKR